MALYQGKTPDQLTLTDAIMTGFRMVMQPNFIIPIVVIGVVINLVVIAAIVPILLSVSNFNTTGDGALLGGAVLGSLVGGILAGIVGGILLNLYGQVWATMASVGEAPTMQAAFARVGERWMSILGAGIIVALVSLAIFLVGGIGAAALGPVGFLIFIAAVVVAIYVGARLSLAGWMAADGAAAMDAIRMSWETTASKILLVLGWSIAYGIVFAVVGGILGAILGLIPLIGGALATAITSAFGFGGGVTLYRKVKGS